MEKIDLVLELKPQEQKNSGLSQELINKIFEDNEEVLEILAKNAQVTGRIQFYNIEPKLFKYRNISVDEDGNIGVSNDASNIFRIEKL